jgi:ferrochelatase
MEKMTDQQQDTAVLLLAYGGPESLEDIPEYLLDIRGGRETPEALVEEITEHYRAIGGRSPLLEITQSAADKLSKRVELPVYVGMRHWHPLVQDVVPQMVGDGVQRIVAICMAPHYSSMSVGAYRKRLEEALTDAELESEPELAFVNSWHTEPHYLAGIVQNVRETLERFPARERDQVMVIFTAHSLPVSILEHGDPYDRQLHETANLLAAELDLAEDRWAFSYQSAAQTGVPWLGPQVEDVVTQLAEAGQRDLLIAPIGFIADHVEILYDIDVKVQGLAGAFAAHVERTPMLNDAPELIQALAALVHEQLEQIE